MILDYDIIVIGGGHAGCEAAAAAARLGSRTLLVTMDMEKLAAMSCNPAVGGVAKGQIVREIDALGGQMGRITDLTTVQFRMLNRSKGAAMWSPRAQCDKRRFSEEWRRTLENTPNLYIWQDAVTELLFDRPETEVATDAAGPTADIAASADNQANSDSANCETGKETRTNANFVNEESGQDIQTNDGFANGESVKSAPANEPAANLSEASEVPEIPAAFNTSTTSETSAASKVSAASGNFKTYEKKFELSETAASGNFPTYGNTSGAYEPSENAKTSAVSDTSEAASGTSKAAAPEPSEAPAQRPRIRGVRTRMGVEFSCRAVVLTAGTFLDGMMHCGTAHAEGGRAGDAASHGITETLRACGFEAGRMKTGTPARLDARTINFEILEPQYGDETPAKFSFSSETAPVREQLPCFLVYTTPQVHETLRSGFALSPLFNGTIRGIGPRYCPSIEDKLRTFADKEQHQLFLEPEGRSTNEYYLNGFSSSLPWEVQMKALRQIRGFEDLHVYRPGYAIEYDYFPPTQLHHSLETKLVAGLYFAGQVNGTTGYEEAAAQGLMAGINAHRTIAGKSPLVLKRDEAYIGVLIDDLVTKGVDEPYRMFTSRAEYRILLRQDNADLRLTPIGYEIGLISKRRYEEFAQKKSSVESLVRFAREQSIKAAEINDYLKSVGSDPLTQGRKLHDLLMRNNVDFEGLIAVLPRLKKFIASEQIGAEAIEEAEIQIKYKGYIEREKFIAEKLRRLENIAIPADFDFHSMNSLTIEARQKLARIRPASIGQASRIPGVSPADVNVLLIKFGR